MRQPICSERHWAQSAYDIAQEVKALRETMLWSDLEKDAAFTTLRFLAERMARNYSLDNPQFNTARFIAECGF